MVRQEVNTHCKRCCLLWCRWRCHPASAGDSDSLGTSVLYVRCRWCGWGWRSAVPGAPGRGRRRTRPAPARRAAAAEGACAGACCAAPIAAARPPFAQQNIPQHYKDHPILSRSRFIQAHHHVFRCTALLNLLTAISAAWYTPPSKCRSDAGSICNKWQLHVKYDIQYAIMSHWMDVTRYQLHAIL